MNRRLKVELFEQTRGENEFGIETITAGITGSCPIPPVAELLDSRRCRFVTWMACCGSVCFFEGEASQGCMESQKTTIKTSPYSDWRKIITFRITG